MVTSPAIFNAFAVAAVSSLTLWGHDTDRAVLWYALTFVWVVNIWLNMFAVKNPRFLTYGPREYLRESEMSHARQLAEIKSRGPQT